VRLADITGKNYPVVLAVLSDIYTYDCGPEYMACFIITAFDIAIDFDATQIFYGGKMRLNRFGIFYSIKRYFWIRTAATFLFMAFCLICSVFFLQMCGIDKDNLGYLSRRLSAVYLAFVTFTYQFR
jgi:hypothetical protein